MAYLGVLYFAFLTAVTVVALRRAQDASTAAFVAAAYLMLLLFLWSVRALERLAPEADAARGRLKVWTWTLATALNVSFACRVAGMMPPVAAAGVWAVSAITAVGGFFICFLRDKERA